jgi:hypothetical protein
MVRQLIDYGTAGANDGEKLFTAIPKLDIRSTRIGQFDPATSTPYTLVSGVTGGSAAFTHEDGDEYVVAVSGVAWWTYDFGGMTGKVTLQNNDLVQWDADAERWNVVRNSTPNIWSMTELRQWYGAYVGEIVQLRQYYTAGAAAFRGAGTFSYIGGPQTDDGGIVISNEIDNGWRRLEVDDTVSPFWFGARGDGVLNDAIAFNDAAAYCRANDAGILQQGGDVIFRIDNTVDFRDIKSVWIEGLFDTDLENVVVLQAGSNLVDINSGNIYLRVQRFTGDWDFDDAGSVGIRIIGDIRSSQVVLEANGFERNIELYSPSFDRPVTSNIIRVLRCVWGKYQFVFKTDQIGGTPNVATDGWITENLISFGYFSGGTGSPSGTRNDAELLFDCDGAWGAQDNFFRDCAFEGNADALVKLDGNSSNVGNRIEAARIELNQSSGIEYALVENTQASSSEIWITTKTLAVDDGGSTQVWTLNLTGGASDNTLVDFEYLRRKSTRSSGFCDCGDPTNVGGGVIEFPRANCYEGYTPAKKSTRQVGPTDYSIGRGGAIVSNSRQGPGIRLKRQSTSVGRPSFWKLNQRQEYLIVALGVEKTFTASGATITSSNHGLANDDRVFLENSASPAAPDLPNGFSENVPYWVKAVTTNTFEISLTQGGASITSTDAGTGTHYWKEIFKSLSPIKYVQGRSIQVYNNASFALRGSDWFFCDRDVAEIIIICGHYYQNDDRIVSFWVEETSGALWDQIDQVI